MQIVQKNSGKSEKIKKTSKRMKKKVKQIPKCRNLKVAQNLTAVIPKNANCKKSPINLITTPPKWGQAPPP